MTDWQEAFDARQKAVREHPLYPTLFHKVAISEALGDHPVRYRNRNKSFEIKSRETGQYYWVDYNYGKSLSVHPPPYGWGPAMRRADKIAEMMLDDIFPDPWPARGDMIAAITGTARDDVRARKDMRRKEHA